MESGGLWRDILCLFLEKNSFFFETQNLLRVEMVLYEGENK